MPGDMVTHTDLLIRICAPRPNSTDASVEAVIDHDSLFYGGTLELDQQQLLAAEADNQAYGQILMKALFSEPIQRAYDRASAKAKERTEGRLRVRLQIDNEVAALQAVRWERMVQSYDGQIAPVATATRTPFSRFAGLEGASAEPLAIRPVRLAVCMSNPANLPDGFAAVDVVNEITNLRQTIGALRQNYQLSVTLAHGHTDLPPDLRTGLLADGYNLMDGPLTLDVLVSQMLSANVVHYLGHGVFRPNPDGAGGVAALYLEDTPEGVLRVVRDDELLPRLNGAAKLPHLVVLMACEGARRAGVQPFAGLAGKLVEAGIPAVLAMQTKLPIEDATELTRRFYADLLDNGTVDLAVNTARSYLYGAHKSDYSIPALFMRLRDGQLLAPDPALSALKAIVAQTDDAAKKPKLPIDVVVTTGSPTQADLERLALTGEPPVDRLNAALTAFLDKDKPKPGFVVMVGSQGSAKTTHLRRLARVTAETSIAGPDRVIPVYVDLGEYSNAAHDLGDPFVEFLAAALRRFWPEMTTERFSAMLPPECPLSFRFLIDGDEQLSEHQRDDAYRHLVRFVQQNPSHQYVVASDFCNAEDLLRTAGGVVTQIHVIKPISQSRAEAYLTGLGDAGAQDLNHALQDNKLFDLAQQPWLLVKMLEQARMGVLPNSRASVLKRFAEEELVRIDANKGMRARAPEVLKSLAWNMTSGRKGSLSMAEAFSVIEGVRGNRGFSTEELFSQLVDQRLLARVGQDRMRFAYPAVINYCAAQALAYMPPEERDARLDDITASLGRLTRLRWWDETLIILSGLLPKEPANRLIELILYGNGSAEGERVFLASRCIQECGSVSDDLLGRVADALIWRSKIANEPRSTLRVRAIEALAGIRAQSAISHLAALAVDKVRKDFVGQDAYEYSSVRLAATLALMRMDEPAQVYLWKERPAVARTLALWKTGKVEELGALLTAPAPAAPDPAQPAQPAQPELSASVAAFALGQIHSARAAELLVAGFQNADLPVDTRWCITDTLKLVDPMLVNHKVLLPFFDEAGGGSLPPEVMKKRQYRYDQLAYLAGQIRSREDKVLEFLDNCVLKWVRVSLKGRAIKAISSIYTPADGARFLQYKQLFEQIAAGDLSGIPLTQPVDPPDSIYLQFSALEALCEMGDLATLGLLRQKRQVWPAELDRQFFLTSEEIYWRNSNEGLR